MCEAAVQGLIESIDLVKESRALVTSQLDHIQDLTTQVEKSSVSAIEHLHREFTELRQCICALLTTRETELEQEVKEAQQRDLEALALIRDDLQEHVESAVEIMERGKQLLMSDHENNVTAMQDFSKDVKAASLQSDMIIPTAQDVACVHVEIPSGLVQEIERQLQDFGEVFARPPVQITSVEDRPGALRVQWAETDEEALQLDEFRLQYCLGSAKNNSDTTVEFHDAYKGPNSSCVVRHLNHSVLYSLRVCGRTSGAPMWSPWSVPLVTSTSMHRYEWECSETSDYVLSNNNAIVTKNTDVVDSSPPLSKPPCMQCGHAVSFKILECGQTEPSDCVFLSPKPVKCPLSLTHNTCLVVNAQGKIFVQGEEKTTKFPALTSNSVVTFDTEVVQEKKVRVTIEVDDKYTAAFDWTVEWCESQPPGVSPIANMDTSCGGDSSSKKYLYFGAQFCNSGWKVSAE